MNRFIKQSMNLISKTLLYFLLMLSNNLSGQVLQKTEDSCNQQQLNICKILSQRSKSYLNNEADSLKDKKLMRFYRKQYTLFFELLEKQISEGSIACQPVLKRTAGEILDRIISKNTITVPPIEILLLREETVNAFTPGATCILVNDGTFAWADSEDMLAAILSHELSHILLRHSLASLRRQYEMLQETKHDARLLSEVENGRRDKAFNLLRSIIYNEEYNSREQEFQADSCGFELFVKAGYSGGAFIEMLGHLPEADSVGTEPVALETFQKFFSVPDHPFNKKWLDIEDFSAYNYKHFKSDFDRDSVATHPSNSDRMERLKKLFPSLQKVAENKFNKTGKDSYESVKQLGEALRVPDIYFSEDYGKLIYKCLAALQKNEHDTTSLQWMGKGLKHLAEARKQYQLNKYLDRIAPQTQTVSYRLFLGIMWNMTPSELDTLANFYGTGNLTDQ